MKFAVSHELVLSQGTLQFRRGSENLWHAGKSTGLTKGQEVWHYQGLVCDLWAKYFTSLASMEIFYFLGSSVYSSVQ